MRNFVQRYLELNRLVEEYDGSRTDAMLIAVLEAEEQLLNDAAADDAIWSASRKVRDGVPVEDIRSLAGDADDFVAWERRILESRGVPQGLATRISDAARDQVIRFASKDDVSEHPEVGEETARSAIVDVLREIRALLASVERPGTKVPALTVAVVRGPAAWILRKLRPRDSGRGVPQPDVYIPGFLCAMGLVEIQADVEAAAQHATHAAASAIGGLVAIGWDGKEALKNMRRRPPAT